MTPDPTQLNLIRLLAPGEWVSGTTISTQLQLSREAISKRMRKLAELDLQIEKLSGRGYRLNPPLELLDPQQLGNGLGGELPVTVLPTTESTNAWLRQCPDRRHLCLAEHQSAGRGRRGRQWQSPFGQNLYLSLRWELPRWPDRLPALGLCLGVHLAENLQEMGIGARLKWPNDLYLGGRKFAGLLIEQQGEAQGPCSLIIGLGVNVAMRQQAAIDQAWTSLSLEGHAVSRNTLAIRLANAISSVLETLNDHSIAASLQRFEALDLYHDREVCISEADTQVCGRSRGLDEWGRLRLQTTSGLQLFSVGDVSLRPRDSEPAP